MRITDAGRNTAWREPGDTFSAKKCRLAVLRARECEIATAQAIGGFFGSATACGRCTGLSFFFDALLASLTPCLPPCETLAGLRPTLESRR